MRIARAAGLTTGEVIARYTIRRGSILRFEERGSCSALRDARCALHSGRPLACRLYPLGIERTIDGERFVRIDPAPGSPGVYGEDRTVADFLDTQEAQPYLDAINRYERLLATFRARLKRIVDFERVEPREFHRRAVLEALSESGYDPNPLIAVLFDSDRLIPRLDSEADSIEVHVIALEAMIRNESHPDRLAAAAVLLAVSLGHSPASALVADIGAKSPG